MATCSPQSLLASACSNGFYALAGSDRSGARGIILQQLYKQAGSTSTLAQLRSAACANGFMEAANNDNLRKTMALSLLCNWLGGV